MPTVSRCVAERVPAFVRCEARPKTLGKTPQPFDYVADAALTRIANRAASERRESRAEDDPCVQKVGVSQAYIAMLEKGTNVNPTLVMLTKLAKALKVKVSELVE